MDEVGFKKGKCGDTVFLESRGRGFESRSLTENERNDTLLASK